MSIEAFGYKQELKRSLSLTDLVVYGMIFIIPIAPFGVYGYVNAEAPGMVPLAYIIGMVAMLFPALSYGSMAKAFPVDRKSVVPGTTVPVRVDSRGPRPLKKNKH